MELRQNVLNYYLDNFDKLSSDKQFHFATRIAAWTGDNTCLAHLEHMRPLFVPEPLTSPALTTALSNLLQNPPAALINAAAARKLYFNRYPQLRGLDFALFRVRHLQQVYGVDAREELQKLVSIEAMLSLEAALLEDHEAIKILSTYAINYMYLLHSVVLQDNAVDRKAFLQVGKDYEASNATQLQLLIYLYTHCIIGETNFYAQEIPSAHVPLYRAMLEQLEAHIDENFEHINLDNKLEYLVCCRICNYDTTLQDRIDKECRRSISTDGTFVVDRHNSNAQSGKSSFDASEHRNVLFIMSGTQYQPHSTSV
jgi:cell division protein FtsB